MDFVAVLDQVITLLRQRGRLTYRTLKRQFELDDAALEDLKEELIYGQRLAADEDERVLVWMGDTAAPTPPASGRATAVDTSQDVLPHLHTAISGGENPHLTQCPGRRAQAGHRAVCRPQGSMELLADRDPEEARQLLDPVLERMMAAVHRYEGTVNQVMGDGIMALFGAPLAHEDHAVRACYAALGMQAAAQQYAAEVQRTHGVPLQMRVGLNAGEVVVRAIGNDLHMDYSAIGQTTHLAARMEQMAMPGSILITPAVLGLAEGTCRSDRWDQCPSKGSTRQWRSSSWWVRAASAALAGGGSAGLGRALCRPGHGTRGPGPGPGACEPARGRWWRSSVRPEWGSPAWCTSVCIPPARRAGWCWKVPRCLTARRPPTTRSSTC